MKIDGVPNILRNSFVKKILTLIGTGGTDRTNKEEYSSNVSVGAIRFRRWVEMALESSHGETLPHNFSIVDDLEGVFRGGYPTKQTIKGLQELGIEHAISLWDTENERENEVMKRGSYELKKAGLEQTIVPLSRADVINNDILGEKIYDLFKKRKELKGKVYIHCENGARRTGYVVAGLRILNDLFSFDISNLKNEKEWDKYRSYGDLKFKKFKELGFDRKILDLLNVLKLLKARDENGERSIYYYSGVLKCDRALYEGFSECNPYCKFINEQMGG